MERHCAAQPHPGRFFRGSFGLSSWFARFPVRVWYISGSSHLCARTSQPRWILLNSVWVENIRGLAPLGLRGASLRVCVGGPGLLTRGRGNTWSRQAASLPCPAVLISALQPTGSEAPTALPGAHLPPASAGPCWLSILNLAVSLSIPNAYLPLLWGPRRESLKKNGASFCGWKPRWHLAEEIGAWPMLKFLIGSLNVRTRGQYVITIDSY